MRTIGLIGGLSWVSTVDYYRIINQTVNTKLGGSHSAKLLLCSIDFEEFKQALDIRDWDGVACLISGAAVRLQEAGADCVVICSNTPHMVADQVVAAMRIPLIHIAEVTAKAIGSLGLKTVGLLGTKFTMEESFFKDKLTRRGINTLVPNSGDREFINDTIFNELTKGIITDSTRTRYQAIISGLVAGGAAGIIMGCTEIPQLIRPQDCPVPTFDTTALHACAAVEFALQDTNQLS